MILKIDYTAGIGGYNLEAKQDIEIDKDAEALGYAVVMFAEIAEKLLTLSETANPRYKSRIALGLVAAMKEAQTNPGWPFDITVTENE